MTGPEDAPQPPPDAAPTQAPPRREYRAAELAEKAGITLRTLRFYRERRLLPPPRREGLSVSLAVDGLPPTATARTYDPWADRWADAPLAKDGTVALPPFTRSIVVRIDR